MDNLYYNKYIEYKKKYKNLKNCINQKGGGIDKPQPSKKYFLEYLANSKFNFSCIIDVGVLTSTDELLTSFPKTKQLLVEPQSKYYNIIKNNYKNNNYELLEIGLDEKEGVMYLEESKIFNSDLPTHNHLTNKKTNTQVKVSTLDKISKDYNKWMIVKIDVDGKDVDILKGGLECLKKTAFLIIEAHYERFTSITDIMTKNNFTLNGIVDLCYIKNSFWQCDLIFINNEFSKKHKQFFPDFNPKDFIVYNP